MAADSSNYRRWYSPFLTLTGFILCIYGIRSLGASYAVTHWPVIPARVVQSSIDSVSPGGFRTRIAYEYFLAGRRYLGSGIDRPAGADDGPGRAIPFEQASAIVARYPVGQELLAGYDPVNPGRAVLRPRFNWWTVPPVLVGAVLATLGVMKWRQRRRATGTVSSP